MNALETIVKRAMRHGLYRTSAAMLEQAEQQIGRLMAVEGLYKSVCANIQNFIHEESRKDYFASRGGENVDELLIEYAKSLEATLAKSEQP